MKIRTEFEIVEKDQTFDARVAEWNARKITYGKDSENASGYYKDNILPEITATKCPANTRERNHGHDLADIMNPDYMILTVGFSYEPLVLSINYIKPRKKILFLYSSETVKNKDKVVKFLNINDGDYISKEIDSNGMEKIDREIKEQYARWQGEYEADNTDPGKNGRVVIDFTGGTKTMAAGGALAGSVIDTKLVYVGSTYDDKSSQPNPGSEYIESIKNPYDIYAITQLKKRVITEIYLRREPLSRRIFAAQEAATKNIDDFTKLFDDPKKAEASEIYRNKVETRDAIVLLSDEAYRYATELLDRQESCGDKNRLSDMLKEAGSAFRNFEIRLQELENKVGG